MKPFLSMNQPDTVFDSAQADPRHSMAHATFPYCDPFFGGSLVAYGPHDVNQPQMLPQMLGLASPRIALPLDLAEDGPIYVNAKQYHGILRRRQSRAKLEAQNKLIKSRKPYLHESRHRHALNRVRGTGGRFLSAKQLPQQSNAELVNGSHHSGSDNNVNAFRSKDASEFLEICTSRTRESASSVSSDQTSLSGNSVKFRQQQPEYTFLGSSPNMGAALQCSGGLIFGGGTQQCAPFAR